MGVSQILNREIQAFRKSFFQQNGADVDKITRSVQKDKTHNGLRLVAPANGQRIGEMALLNVKKE
jgi:hypothetical protein